MAAIVILLPSCIFTKNIIAKLAVKPGCVIFFILRISASDSSSRKSYVNQSFPVSGMTCLLLMATLNVANGCCS